MGEALAYGIYLGTVEELDARRIGFDCIDTFNHSSPQRVYFEMQSTLESSSVVRCERG